MQVFTPIDAAKHATNKYLAVLVAAKYARVLNENHRRALCDTSGFQHFPSVGQIDFDTAFLAVFHTCVAVGPTRSGSRLPAQGGSGASGAHD